MAEEDVFGGCDAENKENKPRLTIRQLRQAAQKEALAKELAKTSQTPSDNSGRFGTVPQKKKTSIFGGLFQVREPTQIALNQVAAQMIAQHGSTSATKVPNVRLEKMPEFVPKVNTKWDGIPELVKQKEQKEKDKEKQTLRRGSFFYAGTNTGSDDGRLRHRNSPNSSSTTASSFGVYGNSSSSQGASSRTRFYAQSVNSSGDLASQQRTDAPVASRPSEPPIATSNASERLSNPRRSSTGSDQDYKPQILIELEPPKFSSTNRSQVFRPSSTKSRATDTSGPPRSSATNRSLGNQAAAADRARAWESIDWAHASRTYGAPSIEAVPSLSASPAKSSQDPPPMTPPQHWPVGPRPAKNDHLPPVPSSRAGATGVPALKKQKSQTQFTYTDAFLAGEARELVLLSRGNSETSVPTTPQLPAQRTGTADSGLSRVQQDLEKRPDSSRARLGLRASMLFTEETTPWDKLEDANPPPPSPKVEQFGLSTKTKFQKPFGKFGK